MPHDHHHNHHHGHDHEVKSTLSFNDKMIKLLDHWIRHNDDHAENYREWAKKASANDHEKAGELLLETVEMSAEITRKLKEIAKIVKCV
jgi:hypothetical protein